jgi:hypothetical protein
MDHHIRVHNEGAWVRAAAEAYRAKKEKQLSQSKN